MDKTYKKWFKELQELSLKLYKWSIVDADCWKDYYDCGYTPKDALNEDMSYG